MRIMTMTKMRIHIQRIITNLSVVVKGFGDAFTNMG
jgi:hypothetical protein